MTWKIKFIFFFSSFPDSKTKVIYIPFKQISFIFHWKKSDWIRWNFVSLLLKLSYFSAIKIIFQFNWELGSMHNSDRALN